MVSKKDFNKKRPKVECEICGEKDTSILHRHHIIERTELECTNNDWNLGVICPSCHSKVHEGSIKIIGVFPGTKYPSGKMLVFVKDGICNVPGLENAEPYWKPEPKAIKLFLKEEDEV